MTDKEYIQAFRNEDKVAFSQFYTQYERRFKKAIKDHFQNSNEDFLADVYQDTIVLLWEKITKGQLTEDTITTTLDGYIYGIGKNLAHEYLRKNKEIPLQMVEEDKDDYGLPLQTVEKALSEESVKEYRQEESESERNERFQTIKRIVKNMGKPCAPLLLNFYWEKKSWSIIASELGYKTDDSAKTQKNKCMNKLKALFRKS